MGKENLFTMINRTMKEYKIHTSNGHIVEIEAENYAPVKKGSSWFVFVAGKQIVAPVNFTHVAAIFEAPVEKQNPAQINLPDVIKQPRQKQ